jgi:hypothetical protein
LSDFHLQNLHLETIFRKMNANRPILLLKRNKMTSKICILTGFLGLGLLTLSTQNASAKSMYIASETGLTLKMEPKAWPITNAGHVAGGSKVEIIETQGAWTKIKDTSSGAEGWVNTSSLSKQPLSISIGGSDVSTTASSDEASLATKGFTQGAETEYRKQNPKLTFKWVDFMEKISVSDKRKESFLQEGRITPRGDK